MQRLVRRGLLVLAALAVFVVPIAVSAAGGFTDVADDNIFKNDIQWMADNDITRGCNPPTNDKFCPSDVVTRETMSAFMHRLGVNKVVDAKTAVTADTATNADKLDGIDGSGYMNPAAGTVGDNLSMPLTTVKKLAELSITTPGPGGLSIQATLTPSTVVTAGASFWLQANDTACAFDIDPFYSIAYGIISQPGNFGTSATITGVVVVPAGANTVTLCGRTFSGATMTMDTMLNAMYSTSVDRGGSLSTAAAGGDGGPGTPTK
jgi:hypothetical protein